MARRRHAATAATAVAALTDEGAATQGDGGPRGLPPPHRGMGRRLAHVFSVLARESLTRSAYSRPAPETPAVVAGQGPSDMAPAAECTAAAVGNDTSSGGCPRPERHLHRKPLPLSPSSPSPSLPQAPQAPPGAPSAAGPYVWDMSPTELAELQQLVADAASTHSDGNERKTAAEEERGQQVEAARSQRTVFEEERLAALREARRYRPSPPPGTGTQTDPPSASGGTSTGQGAAGLVIVSATPELSSEFGSVQRPGQNDGGYYIDTSYIRRHQLNGSTWSGASGKERKSRAELLREQAEQSERRFTSLSGNRPEVQ